MIKLLRCDDRLIHGQCVTKIINYYDVQDIIVIDDFTATNSIIKKIFESALPKEITGKIVTQEESIQCVREAIENDRNTIVLMRTPEIMEKLYLSIPELPKEYNVASIPGGKDKKEVTNFAYLNENQIHAVKQIHEMGVHIWFQLVPSSESYEWNQVESKL